MMSLRVLLVFLKIFVILDVANSFPVQQEQLNGASVKNAREQSSMPVVPGNIESKGMEFQKTTPIPLFSCFDLDICRTSLDFCNERKKVCEKCEDYEHTCGRNSQPVGCTKYCVDLLVAKKLQEERQKSQHNLTESEEAKTSVTTEKPPESKEKSETLDVKWIIIGIMCIFIIVLLAIIVFRENKRKQSATKEVPETQLGLLGKDVETPAESSLAYVSVPIQDDKADVISPVPSAPSMSQEISDPDQTKPKMNRNRDKYLPSTFQEPKICDLHLGRQQQVDKALSEIQQREVEVDEPTSSGYNSALSAPTNPRSKSTIVKNNKEHRFESNKPMRFIGFGAKVFVQLY